MGKIVVERQHRLGRAGAREKAEQLAERLAQQYGVRYRWVGETLELRRTGAEGSVTVDENTVRINLKLGVLLSALAGTIKHDLEAALDKRLG